MAETAIAATDAEAALIGAEPDEGTFRAAADAAAPRRAGRSSDGHGPVEYKRAMVAEMTIRALRLAHERAAAFS